MFNFGFQLFDFRQSGGYGFAFVESHSDLFGDFLKEGSDRFMETFFNLFGRHRIFLRISASWASCLGPEEGG
jgi:hypothetical protein